jgi:hypothetical protein
MGVLLPSRATSGVHCEPMGCPNIIHLQTVKRYEGKRVRISANGSNAIVYMKACGIENKQDY